MRPLFRMWPSALFLLTFTLVGATALVGYRNLKSLANDHEWVSHTFRVIAELDAVRQETLAAESTSRGYRLSDQDAFLQDFDAAAAKAKAHVRTVQAMVRDSPTEALAGDTLEVLVEERLASLATVNKMPVAPGSGARLSDTGVRSSRLLMERLDALLTRMRSEELRLLHVRRLESERTYHSALNAGLIVVVVAFLLGASVYLLFARAFTRQVKGAELDRLRSAELQEEVERATRSLSDHAIELERSNRELEQFAFVASHDLQEPLRKIETFANRIEVKHGDTLTEEARDYLKRIGSAAERMRTLTQNLLEFARVTRRGYDFRPVDLSVLVREAVEDAAALIEESDAQVDVSPLPTAEVDPTHMRQVFSNLVSNSLKFRRPEVPPLLRITSRRAQLSDPHTGELREGCIIEFRDNGIGFDPIYAERIFELFQRLHGRERFEGTGLGLSICRKIVESHGGQITATSIPGEGATFSVQLPLTRHR